MRRLYLRPLFSGMEWSRDFTALVLRFAARFVKLEGVAQDEALLRATPLYPNFRLGTDFDSAQPVWQEFLAGYRVAADRLDWAHRFYLAHARQYPPHPYGCFRYHYDLETRTAGLHFGNLDTSGLGALSRERRPERLRELTAMFADIRRLHPEAETFRGGSWLYNLRAYRSLFPPEYVATATPARPSLTFFDVWGQFLHGKWQLRPEPTRRFLAGIETAATRAELEESFPLHPLRLSAPVRYFYTFYRIE